MSSESGKSASQATVSTEEAMAIRAKWEGYTGTLRASIDANGDSVIKTEYGKVIAVFEGMYGHGEEVARLFAGAGLQIVALASTVESQASLLESVWAKIAKGKAPPSSDRETWALLVDDLVDSVNQSAEAIAAQTAEIDRLRSEAKSVTLERDAAARSLRNADAELEVLRAAILEVVVSRRSLAAARRAYAAAVPGEMVPCCDEMKSAESRVAKAIEKLESFS